MQSEEFDKKIREAASHHHPAYDEQAWDKMHKLLDKHLPEEKDDRRRILFFLLLFLLLGSGIWFLVTKQGNLSKPSVSQQQDKKIITGKSEKNKPADIANPNPESLQKETGSVAEVKTIDKSSVTGQKSSQNSIVTAEPVKATGNLITAADKAPSKYLREKLHKSVATGEEKDKRTGNPVLAVNKEVKEKEQNEQQKVISLPAGSAAEQLSGQLNTGVKKERDIAGTTTFQDSASVKPVNETALKKGQKKQAIQKTKNRKSNFFFVSLSAGPDISYTTGGQLGTTKLTGGIGLGYTFNNRLSLRTGFYSGRKVYAASPDAYNPPPIFWNYYPYLEKVDADCKVYEIPVLASYHFGKPGKRHWFVSAGLSSLIMKQEDYHYTYKYTPNGTTHYRDWSVKNENKHFFSVATVSGGYQKNIGKSITLTAEPYLKLPLGGVGYGKVKLNSTGILFSVLVKPFQQNKQADKKP